MPVRAAGTGEGEGKGTAGLRLLLITLITVVSGAVSSPAPYPAAGLAIRGCSSL